MSDNPFSNLFSDPKAWQVIASGQVEGRISRTKDKHGRKGLRLDYDFHGGGGFVVMRRVVSFKLPETFEIGFQLRGKGLKNHFEFKVVDPGGANVWRHLRQDFTLPSVWTDHRFHERDLPFAWGPAGGGAPTEIGAVEFVIAAGAGGKGVLKLAMPVLEDQTLQEPHAITASSHQQGFPPEAVFAGKLLTGWRAAPGDAQPWWQVDFGRSLRFGGMVITWPESLRRRKFDVEVSGDGVSWTRIHRATSVFGGMSHISTPGVEARHLRIIFEDCNGAELCALSLRPDSFSSTPNEFIHSVAADYPRGWFPRYWLREQSYWTPVGSPEGTRRALINEEGMVEVDEAGFSLEPFLLTAGGRVTWADVETTSLLPKGGAPMPSVSWKTDELSLEILPWIDGGANKLTLHVTYRLTCLKPTSDTRLIVAVRPFQVNPPWQAFRNLGGRSPIHRIVCETSGMTVGDRKISVIPHADAAGAATFEENGIPTILTNGGMPPANHVEDEYGLACGAMAWAFPPDETMIEVTVSVPYFHKIKTPTPNGRTRALDRWRKTLGAVQWRVPKCAGPAFDCFRTAAGHILINRDGPAIQPGPRRYTRSWVRDCVIMGMALAKAGQPKALHEFISWYAQFQREDGFIPCVVDRDGVDWLVEHDSHGQFLWGVREVCRHGGDRKFLTTMMPHVGKAADYLVTLRRQRMKEEFRGGRRTASFGLLPESLSLEDEDTLDMRSEIFGLLPESASHEGYLAHPVHSYWDDFWGVRGLEAAADLAETMDMAEDAERWRSEAVDFQKDLMASIQKVVADKKLNYIPGSVEWADFDPTATANAVGMLDFADALPEATLQTTLETYLDTFRRRHRWEVPWVNYSAYEIRIIGAFVRLGNREVANELLEFFLSDRRPAAWNQWPEITWHDPRSPGHLGDVPHTWIASEYLLALASMVVDEREAADSLVLAAGMPWKWISEDGGFAVRNLPVRHGALDFEIKAADNHMIEVRVGGLPSPPTGGLFIAPPLPDGMRIARVSVDHGAAEIVPDGTSLKVGKLPFAAKLWLETGPA